MYTKVNIYFVPEVCQWLATGRWFLQGTLISSTNNPDRHDITEILLKVALFTLTLYVVPYCETATCHNYYKALWSVILY